MTQAPSPPQPPEPQASAKNDAASSRRRKFLIVLAALAVVGLGVGIPYYFWSRVHESTDDAFIDGHIIPVSARVPGYVLKLHVRDNQPVNEGDLLITLDDRDYRARVEAAGAALDTAAARLAMASANVDLTTITANAALDDASSAVRMAESAVESTQARVAVAASGLDQARTAITVAQAVAEQAKAEVAAAEAQAGRDEVDLKRYQDMYKSSAATQQQLDHAVAMARTSQANLEAARKTAAAEEARVSQAQSALKSAQNSLRQVNSQLGESHAGSAQAKARLESAKSAPQQIAASEAQKRAAQAAVEQAQADLLQAELYLSYTQVRAPVTGYVTHRTVEAGAYVQAGQGLLAIVPQRVWVVANFKETQLAHVRQGQPVSISVDAYPGKTFMGHVDSFQWGTGARFSLLPPENATGNYIKVVQRVPVKIVFEESPDLREGHLAPGMSVVPTVDTSRREGAPLQRPPTPEESAPGMTAYLGPPLSARTTASAPAASLPVRQLSK